MDTTMVKLKPRRSDSSRRNVRIVIIIILIMLALAAGSVAAVLIVDHNRHEKYNELVDNARSSLIEKDYDNAEKYCRDAIDIFADQYDAYLVCSDIYISQGDKQGAKNILEDGCEKCGSPKELTVKLNEVNNDIQYDEYVEAGKKCHQKNNYEDAVRYFKAAIDIKPDNDDPYLLCAESYIANGEKSRARDVLNDGYAKTGSDRIRGKLILVENELQNVEHQQTSQYKAEKEAQDAKRKLEEEKRLKAEEEARKKAEAEAKKKAQKNAKKAEWKDAYAEVLRLTIKKVTDPHYEDPYIREIDDELSKSDDDDEDEDENEDTSADEESADEETASDEDEEESDESSADDDEDDDDDSSSSSGSSSESSGKKKKNKIDDYRFELYDIDGDGIPELFISSDDTDNAVDECYTYANDTAIPLDNHGYRGKISVSQSDKLVRFAAIDNGVRHIDIYKKHGINLDTYIKFFDNFTADHSEENPKAASINDEKTEEGVYNIELRKYNSYKWTDVGRKFALKEDTIEKGISAWHM